MNEAQRKVLVRVSFTLSTLCLLLAGWAIAYSAVDVFLRFLLVGGATLALGFYLRAGRKKKE